MEVIGPSGSREALRASSPLEVGEEGREEFVEYRPCGENEGHRDGNVMVPATFSITLLDENQNILYLGMSPAKLQPAHACTRIM